MTIECDEDRAAIQNVANEMDQLFRQRHDNDDVVCLLRIVFRAGIAAGIERMIALGFIGETYADDARRAIDLLRVAP